MPPTETGNSTTDGAYSKHMLRLTAVLVSIASTAHAGSITGTVLFEGEPPTQETLARDSDPKCSKNKTDEAVVVTKGKVRDVVVRIKNGTAGKHTAPATAAFIDQQDCMYTPRVVGVIAGQKLQVRNSDGTFHNVWGQVANKDVFNKPQAPKAADLTLDATAKPDDVIELKCGVHGWMHAYVAVHDHPYFAVTTADGKFEIKGLPIGTYTLEAWHPVLGAKSMKVVIGKGKRGDVTARFSYKP
jgi:hypothetical protein